VPLRCTFRRRAPAGRTSRLSVNEPAERSSATLRPRRMLAGIERLPFGPGAGRKVTLPARLRLVVIVRTIPPGPRSISRTRSPLASLAFQRTAIRPPERLLRLVLIDGSGLARLAPSVASAGLPA